MTLHWSELGGAFFLLGLASFALNTCPVPENKWGRWLLGVAQYCVLNWGKAADHFKTPDPPKS